MGIEVRRSSRIRDLGMVLFVGLGGFGCFQQPMEKADRALLVTVQDLRGYGAMADPASASVAEHRTKTLDGSLEVHYEFDGSASPTHPLYVTTTASFEATERDARIAYAVLRKSFELTASWEGMGVEAVPATHGGADDSFFATLDYEGQRVGNLFLARQGRKTWFFVVSGFYIDDADTFATLVGPRLAYLEGYTP